MDGSYITANDYFLKSFGIEGESTQGLTISRTTHPDDLAQCKEAAEWCMANPGKSRCLNLRKPTAKGDYLYTRWEFIFMKGGVESENVFQCIGYDITEEVMSAESINSFKQLVESRNKTFETLLANSIDVIFITNEEGIITYSSPVIKEVLGYEPYEMIGKNGFSFVHPDDLEAARKKFQDEINFPELQTSLDLRILKKNGNWLWMEAKGRNLFHDPYAKGMLINLNDISVRKGSEQILAERENRYRSFFNNLSQSILVVSKYRAKIVDANIPALEKYGYTIEEIKNLVLPDLFDIDVTPEELENIYQSGKIYCHKTKSGNSFYVKINRFEVEFSERNFYLLLIEDYGETYNIIRQQELIHKITAHFKSSVSFTDNLQEVVDEIRSYTGWDLVEFWIPGISNQTLRYGAASFNSNEQAIENFVARTKQGLQELENARQKAGSKYSFMRIEPEWIEELNEQCDLLRTPILLEAGFQSVLLIPVKNGDRLVCHLYLFSKTKRQKNEQLVRLLSDIGYMISSDIEKANKELVLDSFFEITEDVITIAGPDSRYLRVNPAFEKLTGYSADEAGSYHVLHFVYDEDRDAVREQLTRLSQGHSVNYFENRAVTKDGTVKWISWTAIPVPEHNVVIATHRDITIQKQKDEAIRVANERYENLKLAANEAIWEMDLKTKKVVRSNGYKNQFGYDVETEDMSLEFWEQKLHPNDRERVMTALRDSFSNKKAPQWQCEYRFQKVDGTYAHVWDKGYIICDNENNPVRMVGSMQDVTELKEFAEKLKLSNERYELVMKATNEAIWDLDLHTHTITWSKGYHNLFGHGFEEHQRTDLDFWINNLHPDDRKRVADGFEIFLKQDETPYWNDEYRFKRKDGGYAYVIDKGYMIFDRNRKPVRVVGAMSDHTKRKILEEELIFKEGIKHKLIAKAAVDAQERERAEIGNELHDNVSQLLTTIKLYLEMLRQKPDDSGQLLDMGIKHVNTVIREIRDLSRSLVPASIDDIGLKASLTDLTDGVRSTGVVEVELNADDEIESKIDKNIKIALYRIVQEQLNNIIKHSGAANVMINIFTEAGSVCVEITDDGKGFIVEKVKKGLGLKNIISRAELLNGSAQIISQLGKGCKLNIKIPYQS
jgi:PAS domain S-box-containing protein